MASQIEVIDLVESDDNNQRPAARGNRGKRGRERDETDENDRTQKKAECKDEALPLPVVFMAGPDSSCITEDLMPLLNILELSRTRTCSRAQEKPKTQANFSILHIQQKDKWSCGFRNLQMMLSALLPRLRHDHPYFAELPESLRPSKEVRPLPSLTDLQGFLEHSWKLGYDPRGKEFYSGSIIGKIEWVGAVEVWSILASRSIDAIVVQFMKRKASRAKLGTFVWNYFSIAGCCCEGDDESCREYAQRLLNSDPGTDTTGKRSCACDVPPLYLQWKGHSVTIVGIRESCDNTGNYDFILFDPAKAGGPLKEGLGLLLENQSTSLPPGLTKNSKTLLNTDVQILMTAFRDAVDCTALRKSLNVVTAD